MAQPLDCLRRAGAHEQAAALLAGDPAAHAPLDNPSSSIGVPNLLSSLRQAGVNEQVTALTDRLPTADMFALFVKYSGREAQFRFGQEADGNPAAPWTRTTWTYDLLLRPRRNRRKWRNAQQGVRSGTV